MPLRAGHARHPRAPEASQNSFVCQSVPDGALSLARGSAFGAGVDGPSLWLADARRDPPRGATRILDASALVLVVLFDGLLNRSRSRGERPAVGRVDVAHVHVHLSRSLWKVR